MEWMGIFFGIGYVVGGLSILLVMKIYIILHRRACQVSGCHCR